jgi:hypothetical protein
MVIALLALALLCSACKSMSRQGHYMVLDRTYPSRSPDCSIELFMQNTPSRPFSKVSRVDVHLEETFFGSPSFEDALSELKKQACLSGADAIIEVQQRRSRVVEAEVYHVTATGIKYTD